MLDLKIAYIALPLIIAMIYSEIFLYKKRGLAFPHQEAWVSVGMTIIFQIVTRVTAPFMSSINRHVFELRPQTIGMDRVWHWVALFFLVEFFYYWQHRAMHGIRWGWASHSVHHSPETITFSGAYRLSITQMLSLIFIFFFPIYAMGFPPEAVGLVYSLNLMYQFWLHTALIPKLGWFEWIFNTPSHHRVHHAINPIYLDKNHGGVLIIFDRLFGTYQEELASEPCRYGLVGRERSLNPLKIFFQEWVSLVRNLGQAESLRDIYLITLGAPGEFAKVKQQRAALRDGSSSPVQESA